MTSTTPDVIIIRGAPGSGKTEAAKFLAAHLQKGVRLEVDTLRSMVISVNWTNQAEHISILSLSATLVHGFLDLGYKPVIVVDTFSGRKLTKYLAELQSTGRQLDVRIFALFVTPDILRQRIEMRPDGQFKDIDICQKLNSDVIKHKQHDEQRIDNSDMTPEETAELILARSSIPTPFTND